MKEIIEEEYRHYKQYVDCYFPYSQINDRAIEKEISELFDKTITLSKICRYISGDNKIEKYSSLIEYNLNNLLYFLPLNELISINTSVRNSVEYIIKLIFYFENQDKEYLTTGYRELNDSRKTLAIYDSEKEKIDNLFEIYSRRSNSIHLKKVSNDNLRMVLETKLTGPYDVKEISRIKQDINNCTDMLLEALYSYKINLPTPEKILLKKVVTKKWWKKLCEL